MYDNSSFIDSVKSHIARDSRYFPSNTSQLRKIIGRVLLEKSGSPEELNTLAALDKDLQRLEKGAQ